MTAAWARIARHAREAGLLRSYAAVKVRVAAARVGAAGVAEAKYLLRFIRSVAAARVRAAGMAEPGRHRVVRGVAAAWVGAAGVAESGHGMRWHS